ncbi:hypothetical protein COCNU_01G013700 [Cocos nucifera]|uniref:Uncharacterized protein n=1 Tax=Cocos nucifera TaxID=13894 RepID=A0A8K0HVM0_COCNU|nr:hypothetical protein COCNU_01G013700 [Cocos nucifera]
MLSKLFGSSTIKLSSLRNPSPAPAPPEKHSDPWMPLRIVHAGGFTERYYMAVPAIGIMEKYPRAVLARPDVFRRPWDSLVQPEEILIPGEKVYLVPRGTIRKLRRRIRRPAVHGLRSKGDSSERKSQSSISGKPAASEGKIESNMPERKKMDERVDGRPAAAPDVPPRNRRVLMEGMWQPSLEAIDEA